MERVARIVIVVAVLAVWLTLVPTLGAAAITVGYSYLIYQRVVPKNGVSGPPQARA